MRSSVEVAEVAAAFRSVSRAPSAEHGWGGNAWYLTVGPGAVKLGKRRIDTTTPVLGLSRDKWMRDNSPVDEVVAEESVPVRGAITGWSQKSRNRMRWRLGSLDYTPLFRPGRMLPKMVTLTLPHEWEWLAPDAATFKKKLINTVLKKKFRRHWGYDLQGVWKLEFQDRRVCKQNGCHDPKAPHLHILMAPPYTLRPGTGETFEEWLRTIWSEACARPDDDAATVRDHYLKGVHIEDTYGLTGTDSKRIADYFVKHGTFSAKEYQNTPPKLWQDETGVASPGRYWGYWGLSIAEGDQFLGLDGPDSGPGLDGGAARGVPDDPASDIMSA